MLLGQAKTVHIIPYSLPSSLSLLLQSLHALSDPISLHISKYLIIYPVHSLVPIPTTLLELSISVVLFFTSKLWHIHVRITDMRCSVNLFKNVSLMTCNNLTCQHAVTRPVWVQRPDLFQCSDPTCLRTFCSRSSLARSRSECVNCTVNGSPPLFSWYDAKYTMSVNSCISCLKPTVISHLVSDR